ncbi:site-specific integrase [Bacillus thuringiensis]|uniref:site-specific integrase n=1 Tax=Bacillus thuringiensis TaxID=1428 RepID=UPI000BF36813|nr:site-specific integrase [Bacillus thuringiensis]PFB55412.1 site-specific integrase [Bacillus thuringiensis]
MASFRKRNDKWEYRVRYKEMGKYKETSKGGFKTKKEAQLAAAKVEEKIANGVNMQDSNITFNDYMTEWLNTYKKGNVSPGTFRVYEKNIRLYISPNLGNIKLKNLTRIQYQRFVNMLLQQLNKKTVKIIHATIHNALEVALNELEIIHKNPTAKVQLKEAHIPDKKDIFKCYDIDELNSFLNYILLHKANFKYYALFAFLSRTGLRIGECLALQWDDINLNTYQLHITKTLTSTTRTDCIKFGPPKNKNSIRTITLDTSTINLLEKIKIEQSKSLSKYGKYYHEYNFIFTHENNSCMLHTGILKFLQRACAEGNHKYITLHGFRHTHAVHLLQSGANIKYVSERLGHSTIDMTANVYLHVTKSMEKTSLQQYDEFLQSCGQFVGN